MLSDQFLIAGSYEFLWRSYNLIITSVPAGGLLMVHNFSYYLGQWQEIILFVAYFGGHTIFWQKLQPGTAIINILSRTW